MTMEKQPCEDVISFQTWWFSIAKLHRPPKINMEPENDGLESMIFLFNWVIWGSSR